MTTQQRILLILGLGLLFTATVLLASAMWTKPSGFRAETVRLASTMWQNFPTRAPKGTATPTALELYTTIRRAILNGEIELADLMIRQARIHYPDDARIVQDEARVAIFQHDYAKAETLIWEAIGLDPTNADNWILAEVIFTHNNKSSTAEQALNIALELNPDLASHVFLERWRLASDSGDSQALSKLADEYYLLHPEDPFSDYYYASALLASGEYNIALYLLVNRLQGELQSPAILWFTLGQVYLKRNSYWESITALENAKYLLEAGDTSMLVLVEEPSIILDESLAKAYLGGQRCAEAETLFRDLATNVNNEIYTSWIAQAVACQTPTPTPTHWMISLQATPTPSPN